MRVLITGGCGFVGRPLVAAAAARHDVHVVDTLRSGEHRLKTMDRSAFALHRVDIRDADGIASLMASIQPDVVVHLAAIHFIPECEAHPALAVSTNVTGTVTLLNAMPAQGRFINLSSAAVYAPSSHALTEGVSQVGPVDTYGLTKLHTEAYTSYLAGLRGFTGWSVRMFNVIGAGETNPHLVPEIVSQLKGGARSLYLGNTSPRRDFVDVHDVVEGLLRLCDADAAALDATDQVINLGSGCAHSVTDVIDEIRNVSGLEFDVVRDPSRTRAVDRPLLVASTASLRSALGWAPESSFTASVQRLWRES
ncbi:MAG: NAD-dependent epimerase/dehydratase [Gemmatimonadetes bacterium]|nr:NAD-dependent epimerase/dehydratase [Gemmatimonadota bacterium]